MQSDLIKVRQSYAEVSAAQKRLTKQKEVADNTANEWYKRAQLALQKGDEELAKEALSRRQTQLEVAQTLGNQLGLQEKALEKLYDSMTALDKKITESKRQKDLFIARARTAKTTVEVTDMLSSLNSGSNSMSAFERMKEKVESLEAQAEVAGELAASSLGTSVKLEDKFKALESDSTVNDELEKLKRQLPGGSKDIIGELPKTVDLEYEELKKQIRGKSS
eukprot:CAMPEP_0196764446 /NCGR_PEP_ID=MMETSP1095-20130614/6155_1 /TAXON_ID=96789 ORGANISM="Chromulina nebulosa, Strain UTEXLB2642" /NCGR_SAMPLE_ID=MMETSP1095 /ASSEMBLY_ACC=CAM_ASM_000446 /LENGTH=220 /DNA_ID=CAMNT_0042120069 /DNA_START=1066 /DNA_END=1728 /DNA_ORIENTATION=+